MKLSLSSGSQSWIRLLRRRHPLPSSHDAAPAGAAPAAKVSTASIVATMLQVSKQVSDLIFSPGRAPQIELNGQLREVNIAGRGQADAGCDPADSRRSDWKE